jgi:hypothetical protein
MPDTPGACLHGNAHALGSMSMIPDGWLADADPSSDGDNHASGWCRDCERHLWRELGSTHWTALTPPSTRA